MWKMAFLLVSAVLAGCSKQPPNDAAVPKDRPVGSVGMKLSGMRSGYLGSPTAMAQFLTCWANEVGGTVGPQPSAALPALDPGSVDARLPKSAQDFVAARKATGFVSLYERQHGGPRFVVDQPLRSFETAFPADFAIWQTTFGSIDIPDDKYYRYDKGQATAFRGRSLPSMLVLGSERGGAFYLMLPQETTIDRESEVMLLHHGGLIVRFKSFGHLLVHLYLEERESAAGRDASLGHLYHFPGPLASTCAKLIIELP